MSWQRTAGSHDRQTTYNLGPATLQTADVITELKLGNGTSILIFANIASALPTSVGGAVQQVGLQLAHARCSSRMLERLKSTRSSPSTSGPDTIHPPDLQASTENSSNLAVYVLAFFLTTMGIVYVQEAERKIPMNYASRYRTGSLGRQSYLPFKVRGKCCRLCAHLLWLLAGLQPSLKYAPAKHHLVLSDPERTAVASSATSMLRCSARPPVAPCVWSGNAPTADLGSLCVPLTPMASVHTGECHRRHAGHLCVFAAGGAHRPGALHQHARGHLLCQSSLACWQPLPAGTPSVQVLCCHHCRCRTSAHLLACG
jgi:SecY